MKRKHPTIALKANRVLNVILIAFLLIVIRLWHLTVIQYDRKLEESRKPQLRTILEPSKRATIRDRFNMPLALNKIQYNAAILYAPMRQIPTIAWEKGPDGKRVKRFKRREYIARLAQLLGQELQLDPERLIDLIHAKAALYFSLPFVIKEQISEKEYYRLKMLEKDWLGIHVQRLPQRYYPRGKVAADIIGYMGAINRQEYENILEEIQTLEIFLRECDEGVSPELPGGVLTLDQAEKRLLELREHAYTINDYVGKAGVEGRFEQDLRGYHGRRTFYSDARGNYLREVPGSCEPRSGQRLLLTISAELQEYAEQLLAQNERIRQSRANSIDNVKRIITGLREPWIKGGSIVAIEPQTGEIVALASYPRFDPNDFISSGHADENKIKKMNIFRWFEAENYISEIWDQKRPLERELYDDALEIFYDDKLWLSWERYLDFVLPQNNVVRTGLARLETIAQVVHMQMVAERLMTLSGQDNAYHLFNALYKEGEHESSSHSLPAEAKRALEAHLKANEKNVALLKQRLDRFVGDIPHNRDKVLLIDLSRVVIDHHLFSTALLEKTGRQSIAAYRDAAAAKATIAEIVRKMSKELFHEFDFKQWRQENEKSYLKEKRLEEKAAKKYAKPYIDYLDAKEGELFQAFWADNGWHCIAAFIGGISSSEANLQPYVQHFIKWHEELSQGAHLEAPWRNAYVQLRNSIEGLEAPTLLLYLKTLRSYIDLTRPLWGQYRYLRKENGRHLEKHLAAAFYPANGFSYGRSIAYRQAAPQGSIFKLVTAYAALAQRHKELPNASQRQLNPLEIIDHNHRQGKDFFVGYHLDGKPLPRAYKGGRLPRSMHVMGHLDLIKAIEFSSNPYFALLAGDILHSPDDLAEAARQFSFGSRTGIDLPYEIMGKVPDDLLTNRTGLYSFSIGQHTLTVTPLQTSVMLSALVNGGKVLKPQIIKLAVGAPYHDIKPFPPVINRAIYMPDIVQKMLLEGMRKVVIKTQETSIKSLSRYYKDYPEAISDYIDLRDDLIGKTSTAEVVENLNLDRERGTNMYTHVWFGGIAFDHQAITFTDDLGQPELVVVVYLKYGAFGKEAAPVAAQMVRKWRDIKRRDAKSREVGSQKPEVRSLPVSQKH